MDKSNILNLESDYKNSGPLCLCGCYILFYPMANLGQKTFIKNPRGLGIGSGNERIGWVKPDAEGKI